MIELDDTPAPLPTDEQIASLLQENERLQAELKKAELENARRGLPKYWHAYEVNGQRVERGAESLWELEAMMAQSWPKKAR